jgi:sterol desaturase/sphingolipid hydroxylase (fatty acid hydroxylase superfamily)
VIVFLPYYAANHYAFSGSAVAILFLSGIFFWTFFEYMMHRFVFHIVSESPRAQKIAYVMHGNHHEFPRDRQRLFMPPVPSLILASIIFLGMYAIIHLNALSFFPGFMLGYLMYGSMHYAIHAWNPPFKWLKPLWRNHHLHHYKNDHQGFGVSTHFWDRVFGTGFDLDKEVEDKQKVQDLMFRK